MEMGVAKQPKKQNLWQFISDRIATHRPHDQGKVRWPPDGWYRAHCGVEDPPDSDPFSPPKRGFSLTQAREWIDTLILHIRATVRESGDLEYELVIGARRNAFLLVEDVRRRFRHLPRPWRQRDASYPANPTADVLGYLEDARTWFDEAIARADVRPPAAETPATQRAAADPYACFQFDIRKERVTFRGITYQLEHHQVAFLKLLVEARGKPVPGPVMRAHPSLGAISKFDRLCKSLPPEFRNLVKTKRGTGYWIPEDAVTAPGESPR
jgi:hypothetical protein